MRLVRKWIKRKISALALPAAALAIACSPQAARAQTSAAAAQPDASTPAPPAHASSSTPEAPSSNPALEVGRPIYAELTQTIDAKKAKPGEKIFAKATLAVLSHGKVLISDGAKISGHVTEAEARSKKNPESVLGIVFDRAELEDGSELPLALTVQAVGVGALTVPTDLEADSENPYGGLAGATLPGPSRPRQLPADPNDPMNAPHPALDVGSTGVVGLKGFDLTEGTDTSKGSLVTSTRKDVKLDRGYELVLRVIPSTPPPSPKQQSDR